MSKHGVIFPPGPKREQLQRIFDDTADEATVVTGAHVKSIFSRSTLKPDVFQQLGDMFGLSDTKIIADEIFFRFGLAVQLMLNATANAKRSKSRAASGASTPRGVSMSIGTNRSGSSTPSSGPYASAPLTARGNNTDFAGGVPLSPADNNSSALQETRDILLHQQQIQHVKSEIDARQSELRQLNEEPDLSAVRGERLKMEKYLQQLNTQVIEKRREQEFARQELKEVQSSIVELRGQIGISEKLVTNVTDDLARAKSALAQERERHTTSLNAELAKAREALYERDVIINQLRNGGQDRAPQPLSRGGGAIAAALDGRYTTAADRALAASKHAIAAVSSIGMDGFGSRPSDQEASWVGGGRDVPENFDEQMTGVCVCVFQITFTMSIDTCFC